MSGTKISSREAVKGWLKGKGVQTLYWRCTVWADVTGVQGCIDVWRDGNVWCAGNYSLKGKDHHEVFACATTLEAAVLDGWPMYRDLRAKRAAWLSAEREAADKEAQARHERARRVAEAGRDALEVARLLVGLSSAGLDLAPAVEEARKVLASID